MAQIKRPFEVVENTDRRTEIFVDHESSTITEKAIAEIGRDPQVYRRGGSLVHVVSWSASPSTPSTLRIRDLPISFLRVRLAQIARFLKPGKNGAKRVFPPEAIVQAVFHRGDWDAVRPLVGVVTSPTIRPDGSVLQEPGYDAQTSVLYSPSERFADVPLSPSKDDARAAATAILDLVCDFPFERACDRSAWLASVLTLIARPAIVGPCPFFGISANTPGSGKSLLVDVAHTLAHGATAPRSSLSNDHEELRKQITSVLAKGSHACLLDNIKSGGKVGGPAFDALLTSTVWEDRELGRNNASLSLPALCVWFGTGNNFVMRGDLPYRALSIKLLSPLEDPRKREGMKHGNANELVRRVARLRKFLVTQACLIIRAHFVAGRPRCGRSWGSFEAWSDVVASAIRWLDLDSIPDPLLACASDEPGEGSESAILGAVIAGLTDMTAQASLTAREIVDVLYPLDYHNEIRIPDRSPFYATMRSALEEATSSRGVPQAIAVGHFLRKVRERIVGDRRIVADFDTHTKVQRWSVKKA